MAPVVVVNSLFVSCLCGLLVCVHEGFTWELSPCRSSMRAVRGDRLCRCQTGVRLSRCLCGSGLELECFIRASGKVAVRSLESTASYRALRIPLCIQVGDRVFAWGTVFARQFHMGSGAVIPPLWLTHRGETIRPWQGRFAF